ncbi:hypothetical protein PCANC_22789 [Puccinia coronata f. sp. avenae]|uniref:Uncharacterized protein n=1 Tax=Puccinia coronata f. sp. avenae TaxID=200324 RepID=A0A2N5U2Y2_9BASI|nr:hypothetical protein PCANC_22789 [Puccinia coronata f. sp. avenae]
MGDVTATFGVASQIQLLTNFKLNGKLFTTKDRHRGNSLVEFQLGSTQRFGEVERIFESAKTLGKTCFIVNPFKEIVNKQDPYKDYPDLNCQLVQTKYEVTEVILSERIIGHVAVLLNPASAFGFPEQTISAVGLGTVFERCSNSRVRPVVGQALSDRSTCRRVGQACPISSWDQSHRTSRDRSDKSVRPVGSCFGRTVPVQPPVEHGCSSTA